MTVLMFFVIYFGSVVLLCSYNFITCGNFWRTDYSILGAILFVLILIVCNMGTQYIGIKRLVDIGITNPKWYLGINFLLLGSILLPEEIKSIIVHSINMVVLVMPRQTIKNNKSH